MIMEPIRVFLAEDDRFAVRALKRHLKTWQREYSLEIAMNGKAASDYVGTAETPPDVAILNLDMPDVSGAELLRQIRTSERLSEIPCILLTDRERADEREALEMLQASAYLAKTAGREAFLGALERSIRGTD